MLDWRASPPTARWAAVAAARSGSLNDCIWNSLRLAAPVLFTPKQQGLINKLQKFVNQLNSAGQANIANQFANQIADTQAQIDGKWHETIDKYLVPLRKRMVTGYVAADLLARRHALGGIAIARARKRLAVVASIRGDEAMDALVREMADPTDEATDLGQRRRLQYLPGMFSAAP